MGTVVYLSLGSNIDDREKAINTALEELRKHAGELKAISSFYETEPWGFSSTNQFLNICTELRTKLNATELLQLIQQIEKELGRQRDRASGYASRIIDIDIVAFGNHVLLTDKLTLPHPHYKSRKFVLLPLAEIAPNFKDPQSAKSIKDMLTSCPDETSVKLYTNK